MNEQVKDLMEQHKAMCDVVQFVTSGMAYGGMIVEIEKAEKKIITTIIKSLRANRREINVPRDIIKDLQMLIVSGGISVDEYKRIRNGIEQAKQDPIESNQ